MKTIILKELRMQNFRGALDVCTKFDKQKTTIMGANGKGKSRHFDAFLWLLYGKDTLDRKDFEIRTSFALSSSALMPGGQGCATPSNFVSTQNPIALTQNGSPATGAEAVVTGTFLIDGEASELKRVFAEKWVKPRGSSEKVFEGNRTDCFWNGVPLNLSQYNQKVEETFGNNLLFKMLTNPDYFAGIDWKLQREELFRLAGTKSDRDLAEGNKDFEILLDKLSNKSMIEFRKELKFRKTKLKEELQSIDPKIEQILELRPLDFDASAVEENIKGLEVEIAQIDAILESERALSKEHLAKINELESLIKAKHNEIDALVLKARRVAEEEAYQQNRAIREKRDELQSLRKKHSEAEQSAKFFDEKIDEHTGYIKKKEAELEKLRAVWIETSEKTYQGETHCPTCHQPLPEEKLEEALGLFNSEKVKKLEELEAEALASKRRISELKEQIEGLRLQSIEARALEISTKNEIETAEGVLLSMNEVQVTEIKKDEINGISAIEKEIKELEQRLSSLAEPSKRNLDKEKERKAELIDLRDKAKARLLDKKRIKDCDDKIKELQDRASDLAEELAKAEREEMTAQSFQIKKIEEAEKRINGLFQDCSFRLFDYTIDDKEKQFPIECCVLYHKGVPYSTTNTANRMNAGLEIINTLSRFHGISAPIFIDNRESVTEIIEVSSQVINLKVSDDEELKIVFN